MLIMVLVHYTLHKELSHMEEGWGTVLATGILILDNTNPAGIFSPTIKILTFTFVTALNLLILL